MWQVLQDVWNNIPMDYINKLQLIIPTQKKMLFQLQKMNVRDIHDF